LARASRAPCSSCPGYSPWSSEVMASMLVADPEVGANTRLLTILLWAWSGVLPSLALVSPNLGLAAFCCQLPPTYCTFTPFLPFCCSTRRSGYPATLTSPYCLALDNRVAPATRTASSHLLTLALFFIESIYRCPASLILYPPSRPTISTAIWNPKPHGHAPSSAHVSHGQFRVRAPRRLQRAISTTISDDEFFFVTGVTTPPLFTALSRYLLS